MAGAVPIAKTEAYQRVVRGRVTKVREDLDKCVDELQRLFDAIPDDVDEMGDCGWDDCDEWRANLEEFVLHLGGRVHELKRVEETIAP